MSQMKNRLASLDVIRGFAMLGILIMNVQSFSMPSAAYLNPRAYGDLNGINEFIWSVGHIFADLKFMTLFSILFGAGVILFCENAEQKSANVKKLHFKRMFGLLLFALIHSYLFWYGDILFYYSICGFIAYFFRNKSVRTLLVLSVVFMTVTTSYSLFFGASLKYLPPEVLQEISQNWKPSALNIEKEINAYHSSFSAIIPYRAKTTFMMQTLLFLTTFLWRITAMMFVGMALYKSQFFHLKWQMKSYKKMFIVNTLIGLVITVVGLKLMYMNDFSFEYGMFIGSQFNFLGSVFLAMSYATAIIFIVKFEKCVRLQNYFAAIGKTAFSNYFLQTLICTTIFYGYGLGYYGQFERWQQALLIAAIWTFQLIVSPLWLSKYRFGPLEWLWRSFTYGRFQPLKH